MKKATRKKVLVVSWHFPPYKSSSAFNLYKRIKDTGFDYDVIQIARNEKPDNETMFDYSSSNFNRYEIEVPTENARDLATRQYFINKVLEVYKQLRLKNHYQVMLSHSHEMVSHLAANEIKLAYPQVQWVASFGDPITANPYNDAYQFPLLEEDCRNETEVLHSADRIVVTNGYQRQAMISSQPESIDRKKFFTLPHCFDERMYPCPGTDNVNSIKEKISNKPFRFLHVGMLYKFKRTSEPFLLAAKRLIEKHPNLKGHFTVEFYGATDQFIKAAANYGLSNVVHFRGTVSYLKSLEVMSKADCLLLRDADFSDIGIKDSPFYPGKLADYFGAKKPIIAVTMATGCVPDMLSDLGGATLTEDDIEGLANSMHDAIKGKLGIDGSKLREYSHNQISEKAKRAMSFEKIPKRILIAGHDLKFARFLIDALQEHQEYEVMIDQWNGHNGHDEERSRQLLENADVIFCEWGLGNLVWYSKNKKIGQKLITRIHAQELRTRHLDMCEHENIDHYIFVSPYYFELMISEFHLDRKKCHMIFNMVDGEKLNLPKESDSKFNLGMIGDVPYSKRLDKAIDIFSELYKKDKRYKLFIKGKRPEDYPWMHSKGKVDELNFYKQQYERIKVNSWDKNILFDGFGPVENWLQKIGWIVSVSDNESFHLAAAEGMSSGAIPVLLAWPGAEYIYPNELIHKSVKEISQVIYSNKYRDVDFKKHAKRFNRQKIVNEIIAVLG